LHARCELRRHRDHRGARHRKELHANFRRGTPHREPPIVVQYRLRGGRKTMSSVTVRPVAEADHDAWRVLYRGYRDFYEVAHNDEAIDTVWSWLLDPAHSTRGLVALVD